MASDHEKGETPNKSSPYYNYRNTRASYRGLCVLAVILWGSVFFLSTISSTISKQLAEQKQALTFFKTSTHDDGKVYPWHTLGTGKKQVTLKDIRGDSFRPVFKEVQWIHSPESASNDQGTFLLQEKKNDKTSYVVKSLVNEDYHYTLFNDSSFRYEGVEYIVDSLKASPDLSRAILKTDTTKGWRHSSTAVYWILDVKSGQISPLMTPKDKISVTFWSPTSQSIAFVFENNVYVRDLVLGSVFQLTTDGSVDIFNGKPDWVYEEEVFASDIVMWWSPRGNKLTFLRFNDSSVPEFSIPYYVQNGHEQYPELRSIKYPKPGYPNPSVEVVVADLPRANQNTATVRTIPFESQAIDDRLITEVLWVSDDFILIKTTNRASDIMEVFLVSTAADATAKLIRTHKATDSWFEVTANAMYVPRNDTLGRYSDGYIDIVNDNGYNHLAYFTPPNNPKPFMLTSGQWEVLTNHIDLRKNEVYFTATLNSSVQRHFYSVNLLSVFHQHGSPDVKRITSGDSWYSGSFSSGSRYLLLNYQGPGVPQQSLLDLHEGTTVKVIESNDKLAKTLAGYDVPKQEVKVIDLGKDKKTGGKIMANMVEILPPGFDETKKYPLLMYVYGGPGSQLVTKEFAIGFSEVVASELNAVVVTVDGRGTGYNNMDSTLAADFKFCVRDKLGHYEPIDQIKAAKLMSEKSYIDSDRIAIWGWSYGGFLTLKTLETDTENVFSYGVAVAPVTKWRLYDSIYTERYLRTPQENPEGYKTASIDKVANFKSKKRFFILHGTGDDNVHFQNSLRLVDDYNMANVENFDFMVFPDSDHSIRYHNGNIVVFDRILDWLRRAFSNEFAGECSAVF